MKTSYFPLLRVFGAHVDDLIAFGLWTVQIVQLNRIFQIILASLKNTDVWQSYVMSLVKV